MTNHRTTKAYKAMTPYEACAIAEGFADYTPTKTQLGAAWQYIVDTGLTRSLQGWYGREAERLIEERIISKPK